jgi:hypothetical protein
VLLRSSLENGFTHGFIVYWTESPTQPVMAQEHLVHLEGSQFKVFKRSACTWSFVDAELLCTVSSGETHAFFPFWILRTLKSVAIIIICLINLLQVGYVDAWRRSSLLG